MPLLARRTTRPPTRPAAAAPPSFDDRLVLAGLSTPDTVLDLADVITAAPTGQQTAPVAALFHRAQARILRPGGWTREVGTDGCGGTCLINAIVAEAHSHRDENEARLILRQVTGGGDPIPQLNQRLKSAGQAAEILARAAAAAEKRGV